MESFVFIFLLVFSPTLVVVFSWFAVSAYRLYQPERTLSIEDDSQYIRQILLRSGKVLPVGVHEIFEDERRRQLERPPIRYEYHDTMSNGLPEEWQHDLWQRRN